MRLISQDGRVDINYMDYDLVMSEDGYAIEAINVCNPGRKHRMAEYSTTIEVLKIMRAVQSHYKKWQEYGDNNSLTMMRFIPPKVFVFPSQKQAVKNYD